MKDLKYNYSRKDYCIDLVPKVDIQAVYIYDMKQATYQFTSRSSEEFDTSSYYAHNSHVTVRVLT